MLAAIFRAANFRLSFPEQFQRHLAGILENVPDRPDWLLTWNPSVSSIDFERFTSASQAVGDIAHQYRGMATIQLWEYFYRISRGLEVFSLDETRDVLDVSSRLWEKAKTLLTQDEQVIKYYIWMASSEIMLELLEQYHSNGQVPIQAEVQRGITAKLETLKHQYKVDYRLGKKPNFRSYNPVSQLTR